MRERERGGERDLWETIHRIRYKVNDNGENKKLIKSLAHQRRPVERVCWERRVGTDGPGTDGQ